MGNSYVIQIEIKQFFFFSELRDSRGYWKKIHPRLKMNKGLSAVKIRLNHNRALCVCFQWSVFVAKMRGRKNDLTATFHLTIALFSIHPLHLLEFFTTRVTRGCGSFLRKIQRLDILSCRVHGKEEKRPDKRFLPYGDWNFNRSHKLEQKGK